ncbi:ABC transporter ATP-binding protein [Thalassotalea aquiviva]|uniref:ABC transporter ATP-binding protein n=1 Tax=Thalassotalea aquiviva TaxID=3242415 RepID=UPI00352AC788
MAIIEVRQLQKHFRDKQSAQKQVVKAVDNVSFEVQQGHCFGLLGPNGAGKTTTIEIMEGIIKPSFGEVIYHTQGEQQINQLIGIQFQHTALQDYLTVTETLTLFASFYQQSIAIDQLIELCDLAEFANRDNRLLSGGQRQRLLLALALINDPQIIFLDEPTTGLDPQSRRHFWALIENIKAKGKTIILTTHYMDEAQQLCDDIVIMDKGNIIEQGSPKAMLARHFSEVFMFIPKANINPQLMKQKGWQVVNQQVEILTNNVEATLRELIELNISLTGLSVKSANLDDLFLKLTGHSLRG